MRFLSGFILGVLVVIGVAYVHDAAFSSGMSGPDPGQARMVNWDVVSRSVNGVVGSVRDEFDRLTGRGTNSQAERV